MGHRYLLFTVIQGQAIKDEAYFMRHPGKIKDHYAYIKELHEFIKEARKTRTFVVSAEEDNESEESGDDNWSDDGDDDSDA